ncbi:MFS transporter [Brasilonema sp. UFV-L1]|uniref:MFS transporter n=1 Tax=Brasilonema sp. UFV-L1 TaxID=2234130 RepID=UPI00145F5265|nr:MFS transporter [Brasilonema sp. UFV-L1]NMG06366.1 MFS transporter [Brasilonema sp. UFV-L1]
MKSNHKSVNNIYQDKNLYITIGVTLVSVLGVMTLNPILPTIGKSFNLSPQQIGLIMTSFLVPIAIGTPIFGVLADRIGRKKILVPSLLLFALGGTLSAFAQDFRSLLEWRFLQGIGAASLETLSLTMIGDLYSGKMLTTAMALSASMIGISATVYPLIGGGLAQLNWRYTFVLSLLAIPLAVLVSTKLKLPKKQSNASHFHLNTYLKDTWSSINNRQVIGLMFAVLSLFILEFGACFICVPLLAANSLGASGAVIGVLLAIMELSLAFFASQLGLFTRKLSETTLIKVCFVTSALALLMIPVIHNVWLLLLPMILFGAALGIGLPSMQTMFARLAPENNRAAFMALNVTLQSVGRAVGPALAGIGFGVLGIKGVFYASAGFAFITFVLLSFFSGKVTQTSSYKALLPGEGHLLH